MGLLSAWQACWGLLGKLPKRKQQSTTTTISQHLASICLPLMDSDCLCSKGSIHLSSLLLKTPSPWGETTGISEPSQATWGILHHHPTTCELWAWLDDWEPLAPRAVLAAWFPCVCPDNRFHNETKNIWNFHFSCWAPWGDSVPHCTALHSSHTEQHNPALPDLWQFPACFSVYFGLQLLWHAAASQALSPSQETPACSVDGTVTDGCLSHCRKMLPSLAVWLSWRCSLFWQLSASLQSMPHPQNFFTHARMGVCRPWWYTNIWIAKKTLVGTDNIRKRPKPL